MATFIATSSSFTDCDARPSTRALQWELLVPGARMPTYLSYSGALQPQGNSKLKLVYHSHYLPSDVIESTGK